MRSASSLHVLLASVLALAAACSSGGAGTSCETEANCPARSRCVDRLCVADAPPVARLDGPATAVENALTTFDGSASGDPDADDAIAAWRWSLRPVDAACDAPAGPPSSPAVHVRFPCAGRWGVDLVVADALGVESAVASREVAVAAWTGPARVTAGEDATVAHACAGEPLRCTTADAEGAAIALPLSVAVAADDADAASLAYVWTVTPPPGLALSDERRVTLSPRSDGAATAVVETDGAAIAGQWVFTVEVQDAAGVVGSAKQVVTVENREPVATVLFAASPVPHRYDASGRFLASGTSRIRTTDPDGDPLTRRVVARHLNDGPEDRFEVNDDGEALAFLVEVLYTAPEDAANLIGDDVVRELELTVDDGNGGVVTQTLPVVVGNRPPRAITSVGAVSTGHTYDTAASAYRASAALTRFLDDDGDPLVAGPTGNAICGRLVVDNVGQTRIECALAHGGAGIGPFATQHAVAQQVLDPWIASAPIPAATVTITNRAPILTLGPVPASVPVTCTVGAEECCDGDGTCFPDRSYGSGTTSVSTFVTDEDGDPVSVVADSCGTTSFQTCFTGSCGPLTVRSCATSTCDPTDGAYDVVVTANDGAGTDSERFSVGRTCK